MERNAIIDIRLDSWGRRIHDQHAVLGKTDVVVSSGESVVHAALLKRCLRNVLREKSVA